MVSAAGRAIPLTASGGRRHCRCLLRGSLDGRIRRFCCCAKAMSRHAEQHDQRGQPHTDRRDLEKEKADFGEIHSSPRFRGEGDHASMVEGVLGQSSEEPPPPHCVRSPSPRNRGEDFDSSHPIDQKRELARPVDPGDAGARDCQQQPLAFEFYHREPAAGAERPPRSITLTSRSRWAPPAMPVWALLPEPQGAERQASDQRNQKQSQEIFGHLRRSSPRSAHRRPPLRAPECQSDR